LHSQKLFWLRSILKGGYPEKMDVFVDPEICISCGTCIDLCPEVYDWDDDGRAKAIEEEVPDELEDSAREALESCPVDAIQES
jgi:ferredoxin